MGHAKKINKDGNTILMCCQDGRSTDATYCKSYKFAEVYNQVDEPVRNSFSNSNFALLPQFHFWAELTLTLFDSNCKSVSLDIQNIPS